MAEHTMGSVGVRQAEIANEETKLKDGNNALMTTARYCGGKHEGWRLKRIPITYWR